eukprot:scaffold4062_cov26-Tisochrysis_lutea.AAC.1
MAMVPNPNSNRASRSTMGSSAVMAQVPLRRRYHQMMMIRRRCKRKQRDRRRSQGAGGTSRAPGRALAD